MEQRENKNKFYNKGSVEHIKYCIQKYNLKEDKVKYIENIDYEFLKKNLNLWEERVRYVYGDSNFDKILRVINNIKLKKDRRPINHFLMEHKDKLKYKKPFTKKEDYNNFFAEAIIKLSEQYNSLTEKEKMPYIIAFKKEQVLYETEILLIKNIFFMAFNPFIKSHDKLIKGVAEFCLKMHYYLTYLDSGEIDLKMGYGLEKEWNKNISESCKEEIKYIYKKQKELIEEALKIKNQNITAYYNEAKENYNKNKNERDKVNYNWDELDEIFKIKYHREKYKEKLEKEILYNIKCLNEDKEVKSPSNEIELFIEDISNFYNCGKDFDSFNIVNLWEKAPDDLKLLYKQAFQRKKIECFYINYIKKKKDNKIKNNLVGRLSKETIYKDVINENLP